jgi:glutathione S-transferase
MSQITLYGSKISGNCWKPAALMDLRGMRYEWVEIDLLQGEARSAAFLRKNPNGKTPLLEVDGRYLAESNAMLCYLAEGSPWLPDEPWTRAQVMQWLFFEQYSHEPYVATVRWWVRYLHKQDEWAAKIAEAMHKGHAAFVVMEQQLGKTPFLVGETPTIADLALFAYTDVADEGGYSLSPYPAITRWLDRLHGLEGFKPMRARG